MNVLFPLYMIRDVSAVSLPGHGGKAIVIIHVHGHGGAVALCPGAWGLAPKTRRRGVEGQAPPPARAKPPRP